MKKKVYLEECGCLNAAGAGGDALVAALWEGKDLRSPLAFNYDFMPHAFACLVKTPDIVKEGCNRQALKTSEKQAKLALACAAQTLGNCRGEFFDDPEGSGLFVGIPLVETNCDYALSDVLPEMQAHGSSENLAAILMNQTPPLSGLTLLNSTLCSHLAGEFNLMGEMGGYSHFADAGMHALIEAALSLEEGANKRAVVGGVSTETTPFTFLQFAALGFLKNGRFPLPGEGSAFLKISSKSSLSLGKRVVLSGFGRSFDSRSPERASRECFGLALENACLSPKDIDWVVGAPSPLALQGGCFEKEYGKGAGEGVFSEVFGGGALPAFCTLDETIGFMGPASALTAAVLGIHGLRNGYRLHLECAVEKNQAARHRIEKFEIKHVLVQACGPHGQSASVILSLEF